MFEERRITKWMESARLLHLKSAYFNLFDARGILRGKRVVAETLPSSHEDSVDRILEDVDQCYGRPKQIVQKMPDYDFPPSLGLHIQTMIVILLSGEFKGFCDMLVTDWRRFFQAKIWREKKKTFEENYKECKFRLSGLHCSLTNESFSHLCSFQAIDSLITW